MKSMLSTLAMAITLAAGSTSLASDTVKIGLNYPKTGPYSAQGLDQQQAAKLAIEEINKAGGVFGKQVEVVETDDASKPDVATANFKELVTKNGAVMVFGGSASNTAVAQGKVAQELGIPFFPALTYATDTTGKDGQRFMFRECYDSFAAAKVLGEYMNKNFAGKKYLYITADYNWGHTTEGAFRKFTNTASTDDHKQYKTPFPNATEDDFKKAIAFAKMVKPDVLVLVLFGKDMEMGIRQATAQGLKSTSQIVVPNLTLGAAEGAGPKVMEGVIGALPWAWNIPGEFNFAKGQEFVNNFAAKYNRYPCTSGASAYTILYQWKDAVERAKSFDGAAVVKALEGHTYTLLKDQQQWRDFDHQSIQTVYAVKCKPEAEVTKDKFKLDFFKVLGSMTGSQAFITREEWNGVRTAAGKPTQLQSLPGEAATATAEPTK